MQYKNVPSAPLVVQETREFNAIFIHSKLDDAGLTAAEFRIYGHLARRAGANGAYPSLSSMARVCKLSRPTVVATLNTLWELGMIEIIHTAGKVNRYFLSAPSCWKLTSKKETPVSRIDYTSQNEILPLVKNRPTKDIHISKSIEGSNGHSPSPQKEFIEQWHTAYETRHGCKYQFQGVKDGSAASRLVKCQLPSDLITLAKGAWKQAEKNPNDWTFAHSDTIARFASEINGIQSKLKNLERQKAKV